MKSISLVACIAAVSALCVSVSCSSSSDKGTGAAGSSSACKGNSGPGEGGANPGAGGANPAEAGNSSSEAGATHGEAGANPGSGGSGGGASNLPPAPKATLCPESDPISPKNANSVSVQGVVLSTDAHWTADKVYLIGDDYKIEGAKLTIDAGTTICEFNGGKIYVGQGIDPGEIHINGTADKHVTITGFPSADDATKLDAPIGGIQFDTYQGSVLSYLDVWYGGPGGGSGSWAFELTDTAQGNDKVTPLLIDHLTIGEVQSEGFRIGTPNGIAANSSITFTGFAPHADGDPDFSYTAALNFYAEKSVAAALTMYTDNIPAAVQRVQLLTAPEPFYLRTDMELTDVGLPYWYKDGSLIIAGPDDGTSATLTIDAGVTLHMGKQLQVGDQHEGDLIIAGTAAKPVTLTSAEETPGAGDWEGIFFIGHFYDPTRSMISYLNLEYAGLDEGSGSGLHVGRCGDDFTGAIQITSSDTATRMYDGPSITHTHISHSQTYGIAADAGIAPAVSGTLKNDYTVAALGNTFTDCMLGDTATSACPVP
ncbi:MAG TPA: hypothetical protein VHW01_17155 [Polyangiaceae bacterium]|jgi:hypothetical protein|nr:hypothetical protein [Polyangiaceae bacterium]